MHAIDNLQPLMLNHSNNGGDWREHGVTRSQVMGRQQQSAKGSAQLWEYIRHIIEENIAKGNILDP